MTISFIVPAFNEEKYIADCLDSIFGQEGLSEFEVIVVDNNSADRTAEIVKKQFPPVKLIQEIKKGPAAARNAGAGIANGELLAFIDADCRLPRDWWNKVEARFAKDKDLILLYGPYRYFEVKNPFQKFIFYLSNVLAVKLGIIFGLQAAYGGNTVIKRAGFEQLGGFGDFEFYGEDVDFVKRAAKLGKIKFDSKLWVYSSLRRLKKEGVLKMWWIYATNAVSPNKKRPFDYG